MQVVVKAPRMRIDGEISTKLVEYLRKEFGEIEVIAEEEDELIEVTKSEWYWTLRKSVAPGENVPLYRELFDVSVDKFL